MVQLYPDTLHEEGVSPDCSHVDSEIARKVFDIHSLTFHGSFDGEGKDKTPLIKALGCLTPKDRCKVPGRYQIVYQKHLKEDMVTELGRSGAFGFFGTALQYLSVPPHEAECYIIDEACAGMGANRELLTTIICGRTNEEMEILKATYQQLHGKDLGRVLDAELGGTYEELILHCLASNTEEKYDPENVHTPAKVKADAKAFYDMGEAKWFANIRGLLKFICDAPAEHLYKVNHEFADHHGITMHRSLEKEMSGELRRAALFTMGMKLLPHKTIAELLHDAMRGVGCDELLLTSTLIRYQAMLPQAKVVFEEMYGQSLEEVVASETGGNYEKLLLEIIATADKIEA